MSIEEGKHLIEVGVTERLSEHVEELLGVFITKLRRGAITSDDVLY